MYSTEICANMEHVYVHVYGANEQMKVHGEGVFKGIFSPQMIQYKYKASQRSKSTNVIITKQKHNDLSIMICCQVPSVMFYVVYLCSLILQRCITAKNNFIITMQ